MGRYWPDANVFIWGNREPYPLPGYRKYWDWFEKQVDAGKIITHWKVIEEVLEGENKKDDDPIVGWVKSRRKKLTAAPDTKECQHMVGRMCKYACEKFGVERAVEFTRGADLHLIASARLDDGTVVTQESTKKLVRIPTVCEAFGVRHITLYRMSKELKIHL